MHAPFHPATAFSSEETCEGAATVQPAHLLDLPQEALQQAPGPITPSSASRLATPVGGPPDALAALRGATQAVHARLEQISPLMQPQLAYAHYRAYLLQHACLVAAAEAFAVAAKKDLGGNVYPFSATRRHGRLLGDLRRTSAPGDAGVWLACSGFWRRRWAQALSPHASLWGRLGVLYVLEGSTLGGQILSKHLSKTLGLPAAKMTYLAGYGRATGAKWRATCTFLRLQLRAAPAVEAACAAATTTFELFARAGAGLGPP